MLGFHGNASCLHILQAWCCYLDMLSAVTWNCVRKNKMRPSMWSRSIWKTISHLEIQCCLDCYVDILVAESGAWKGVQVVLEQIVQSGLADSLVNRIRFRLGYVCSLYSSCCQ